MIIVSSEIFFFKYFDFIKDINIRVLSQSADIASFLIQFSKLRENLEMEKFFSTPQSEDIWTFRKNFL